MSCDMWFGTQEYATWIPTPLRGADVSAQGWGESGSFLNGGAFAFHSYNSHKEFDFSWRTTSSRKEAQTMMSFYSGTFGRGKLYFLDPLTMKTNVLPARWADPSITCDFEGESLVPGVDPLRVSQTDTDRLQLPVTAAQYDLSGITEVETDFNVEATNLFTNPNLVGDGTWAEVRRNYKLNPSLETGTTTAWGRNAGLAGSSIEATTEESRSGSYSLKVTVDGTAASQGCNTYSSVGNMTIATGEAFQVSAWVKAPVGITLECAIQERDSAGAYITRKASSTITGNGKWQLLTVSVPAGEIVAGNLISTPIYMPSIQRAAVFYVDDMLHEFTTITAHAESYFDGSSPAFSVDPDMRQRWLGAPNESESVMEIERVRDVIAGTGSVAGVSTWQGKPALRLMNINGASTSNFAVFAIPPAAQSGGTLIATRNQLDVVEAVAGAYNLRAANPAQQVPATNVVGSIRSRLLYTALTSTYSAYLGARLVPGFQSVWWTDIGLFAGDYDGEAFSGDSEVPGKVTRWAGTPNASPSELGHLSLSTSSAISDSNALFVPLPDGMQLNVGAFYQSTTAGQGVYVTPATRGGGNTGVVTRLTPITPSAADTLPDTFTKTPGVIGVWVWIGKTAQGPGVVTVNALHARVTPLGSASTGEAHWYGGQGNEGVRFLQPPTYINHTGVDGGQVEFAATFTEVSF